MIDRCEQYDGLLMRIASLGFAHGPRYGASLVMRRPVSSGSSVGEKTACGTCGRVPWVFYAHKVRWIPDLPCGDTRVYLEVAIRRVFCQTCRSVKQEQLTWLAHSPLYTKRFAFFVGRRCRASPIRWGSLLSNNLMPVGPLSNTEAAIPPYTLLPQGTHRTLG